jgi:hypothetical protein
MAGSAEVNKHVEGNPLYPGRLGYLYCWPGSTTPLPSFRSILIVALTVLLVEDGGGCGVGGGLVLHLPPIKTNIHGIRIERKYSSPLSFGMIVSGINGLRVFIFYDLD